MGVAIYCTSGRQPFVRLFDLHQTSHGSWNYEGQVVNRVCLCLILQDSYNKL